MAEFPDATQKIFLLAGLENRPSSAASDTHIVMQTCEGCLPVPCYYQTIHYLLVNENCHFFLHGSLALQIGLCPQHRLFSSRFIRAANVPNQISRIRVTAKKNFATKTNFFSSLLFFSACLLL